MKKLINSLKENAFGISAFLTGIAIIALMLWGMVAGSKAAKEREATRASICAPHQSHISTTVINGVREAKDAKDLLLLRMEVDKYIREKSADLWRCNLPQEYQSLVKALETPPASEDNSLTGAVVGGLLLGPVGAVAGALVGK